MLAFAFAFVLLAEAMVVIAWARNWQVSWWEWHVLMLASFLLIALVARTEWHEERFSALYLDETLAGARDVSVVLADLAGFTAFTERHAADEVAAMLNAYFGRDHPADGARGRRGAPDRRRRADGHLRQGRERQRSRGPRRARGARPPACRAARSRASHDDWPRFRVGVYSGEVHAGLVGATRGHRKHGVVGDVVNLAARLQAAAPGRRRPDRRGDVPRARAAGGRRAAAAAAREGKARAGHRRTSSTASGRPAPSSRERDAARTVAAPLRTLRRMSDGAAEPSGRVERLARRPLEHLGGVARGVVRALPRAIEDMFADRCTQYAAAIAYRVLFSLFPLTIALVSIFGLVLQDDELRQKVIDELDRHPPGLRVGPGEHPDARSSRSRRRCRRSGSSRSSRCSGAPPG